jgi:hypothetical protein
MRVLGALFTCLVSPGDPSKTGSVIILQTLFQALFSLQGSLLAEGDSEGASYVHELIKGVKKIACEGLNASLLMQQYGDQVRSEADAQAVLDCVIVMALAACMENAPDAERRYMLNNVMTVKVSISCICLSTVHDFFKGRLVQCDWVVTLLTEPDAHRITQCHSIHTCSLKISTFN